MAAIGLCFHTCVYTHKRTCAHKNTFKHTVCSTSCVELSGWHHLQLQCQRVKGDHCLAALAPCPSAPLWVCFVCVSVCAGCCQCDSMTSLIKFAFLEVSFMYIYNIIILYIFYCLPSSLLLASSSFPPFLLASLLLLFF